MLLVHDPTLLIYVFFGQEPHSANDAAGQAFESVRQGLGLPAVADPAHRYSGIETAERERHVW
ncbi:MAG: hypothetical protein JXA89_26555, partial [Anaerolineae bacterium]|nr:hypothetical protein [Anaerolineae bacterium]